MIYMNVIDGGHKTIFWHNDCRRLMGFSILLKPLHIKMMVQCEKMGIQKTVVAVM